MDHSNCVCTKIMDGITAKGGPKLVVTERTQARLIAAKMLSTSRTPKELVTVILADLFLRMPSKSHTGTTTRRVSLMTSRARITCQRAS